MKKRTKYFKTSKQVVLGKKFSGVNFFFFYMLPQKQKIYHDLRFNILNVLWLPFKTEPWKGENKRALTG